MIRNINQMGDWLLPTLARLIFAAVLLGYFWASALTKFDGPFTPSVGAFAQIYPRAFEAAGYDAGQMGLPPTQAKLISAALMTRDHPRPQQRSFPLSYRALMWRQLSCLTWPYR